MLLIKPVKKWYLYLSRKMCYYECYTKKKNNIVYKQTYHVYLIF